MAPHKALGSRKVGSAKSAEVAAARDTRLKAAGPDGGWMTVVDFSKVTGISRPTLAIYKSEGLAGFRDPDGVHPQELFVAILNMKIDKAKPAGMKEEEQAKRDITIAQGDKAKRTMQMVKGRTAHIDDLAFLLKEVVQEIDGTIRAWPKTLTVDTMSFLSQHLIAKAALDPDHAADRRRAVEVSLGMLDQQELSRHLTGRLDARLAAVGDMFRSIMPSLIKRAIARGEKAAGIR